jgi:hypothetical protein
MSEGARDRTLLYALIAVAVALLINAMVMAAPECSPAPQSQGSESTQHNNHGQSDPLGVLGVLYAPFCGLGYLVIRHKDVIDGLSTFVIAAFTIVLAFSTVRLWRETERLAKGADDQSEKMERNIKQARRLALATMVSARATRKSAAVAEKALYTLEGSHVEIARLEYEPEIRVRLKNYGRTAATVHYVTVHANVEPWQMGTSLKFGQYLETLEGSRMIAAGEDDIFSTRFFSDRMKNNIPNITSGTHALRVNVTYQSSGNLGDRRGGGAWFVWDFRYKQFIRGFELPAFDPKLPRR